jgi:hypothetical protein
LECSWSVTEAKGHDQGFIEAGVALKSGFVFIALFDADVVISPTDIELGVITGAL